MAERETKEFVTPGNHKVVLRTYLTGREMNDIRAAMFSAMKLNMDDVQAGKVNVSDIPGSFIVEQEQKALGILLVSVDGNSNNPVDALLDLPASEQDAVIKEVNKIQNPTTPEK